MIAGVLDDATLSALRDSDDVESIEEDGIMHAFASVTQYVSFLDYNSRIFTDARLFI